MPIDNTIALQAKAPEFNPLQMALQTAQFRQSNLQSNQLQQSMQANQAVSQAIQRRTSADGKVDLAGVQSDLSQDPNAAYNLQATTSTNLEQQGKQTANSTAGMQNQSTGMALRNEQMTHLSQQLGTLLNKPDLSRDDVATVATQAGKLYGLPDQVVEQAVKNIPQDPTQLKPYIQARLGAATAPATQQDQFAAKPTAVSTGGTTQFVDSNPLTNAGKPGSVGSSLPNTLPPGQLETVGTDSNQNATVTVKNPQGQVTAYKGAPVVGAPTVAPNIIPPGESQQSMNELRQQRDKITAAAAKNPDIQTYSDNIIRIASDPVMMNPHTFASASTEKLRQLGFTPGTDYKTALDQIGHNLALSTQANESAMGVSTDAGRKTSGLAAGTTEMNIPALVNAVKMNAATSTGMAAYNKGKEAAIAAAGGNVAAMRPFQNAWSQVYSPVVMQLYNAAKKGDTAEQQNIMQEMGYKGPISGFWDSPQGKPLLQKAQAMESLTKTGSLPKQGSQ